LIVTVLGGRILERFAKQHADARKPLSRFLGMARAVTWKHFPEVKQTFPATDYAAATGTLIFDISGNKYRLIALVNFEKQTLLIDRSLTHGEYNREDL
jgi:mRNA interferase HigB